MENDRNNPFTPATGTSGIGQQSDFGTTGRTTDAFDATSGTGSQTAQDNTGKVKEKAREAKEMAADRVESRINEQKYRATGSLSDIASSLRTAGEQLPSDNGMSRYITRAADQVDHLAGFLDNRDVAELMGEVEDFARRQPAAFLGGAFALGVLGARFLKSSRRDRTNERLYDEWGPDEDLTSRLEDPTRDAISRPAAPGYVPPSERNITGDGAPGYL
jgi:hypothetical protein